MEGGLFGARGFPTPPISVGESLFFNHRGGGGGRSPCDTEKRNFDLHMGKLLKEKRLGRDTLRGGSLGENSQGRGFTGGSGGSEVFNSPRRIV